VGPYRIEEEIARGGMGVVLRAHDADFGRTLAVKLMHAQDVGRPEMVQRFLGEAQLTAQLQHPGIPPVHARGQLEDGRPYFAMKLVKGRTMADLLACRHGPADDLPRMLGIFQQVCQTIAFVHSRGVIHRDLKPANIMVGAFGEVQVMDWGLAKVLGSAVAEEPTLPGEGTSTIFSPRSGRPESATQAGSVLGTPAYMAPEQARGLVHRLDERSDVFGLGAILCVVLTGQPPYVGPSGQHVLEKAENGDLAEAHERLRLCGAGPELIALARRCLSADRDGRPRCAAEVADAVAAYEAGARERLRQAEMERAQNEVRVVEEGKQRRLQRALLAAALVVLAVSVAGALIWQNREAERRQDVEAAFSRAAELRDRARWAEAAQALDHAEQRLGGGPRALRDRLERERADLELAQRLDTIRLDKAALFNSLAQARADTEKAYERAFREAELTDLDEEPAVVADRVSDSAIRVQLVAALDDWAATTRDKKRRAWLLEVARRADGEASHGRFRNPKAWNDATVLAGLAREAQEEGLSPQLLAALATQLAVLGENPLPLLKKAQARHPSDFWLTFDLAEALLQVRPAEAVGFFHLANVLRPETAYVYTLLGSALEKKGELDEAITWHQKALALDDKLAFAHANLGVALDKKGKPDEAIARYKKALALNPRLFRAHYSLGAVYQARNEYARAIACYRKALEINPQYEFPHYNLGLALRALGQDDEAIPELRRSVRANPNDYRTHMQLGLALHDKNRTAEAIFCFRQAVKLEPRLSWNHFYLGSALVDKGEPVEAIVWLRQAVALSPKHAEAHASLSAAQKALQQLDAAAASARRAIECDPKLARGHNNLGAVYLEQGRSADALLAFNEAVKLDPKVALYHISQGLALRATNQPDRAILSFRKAITLDDKDAQAHALLGALLALQGQHDAGITSLQRALKLDPKNSLAHNFLGRALLGKGERDRAITCFRKAAELAPQFTPAHRDLAEALRDRGDLDGAIASYRKIIALNSRDSAAHFNLGNVLDMQGKLDQALQCYNRAIELSPRNPGHLAVLGGALYEKGKLDEAVVRLRQALALNPRLSMAHDHLGLVQRARGEIDEAIASFRKALEYGDHHKTHSNLGLALAARGRHTEALDCYKKALKRNPQDTFTMLALGRAYLQAGRFDQADATVKKCLKLLPKDHSMRPDVERLAQQSRAWGKIAEQLPAYLKGDAKPRNAAESLQLAWLCQTPQQQRYAAAARFYADAFASQPKLANDLGKQHRYLAACAAVRAASGQGKDAPGPDDKERPRLRQQALDWLKADLAEWARLVESGVADIRPVVQKGLKDWRDGPHLSSVRGVEATAKLPEAERAAWRQLWADVEARLPRAKKRPTPDGPRP
jgi:tetratricopeptide (TPR) repeat protein